MTARSFPVPLGVSEADLMREQRAAEWKVVEEHAPRVLFPRSQATATSDYVEYFRSQADNRRAMFAFCAQVFEDENVDPALTFTSARNIAVFAARIAVQPRDVYPAERSLLNTMAREAFCARVYRLRNQGVVR